MQVIGNEAKRFATLKADQLAALTVVPCKRAQLNAERAATRTQREARDKAIDEQAKEARMLEALAEPADVGAFLPKRKRNAVTPAPKRARKSDPKRPAKRPAKRLPNPALAALDQFSSDVSNPAMSEPFEAAITLECTTGGEGDQGCRVLVDGEEEWVVDRITGEKEVEIETLGGGIDVVKKYQVVWVGGEVTWELHEAVQDCQALDEYEKRQDIKRGKRKACVAL